MCLRRVRFLSFVFFCHQRERGTWGNCRNQSCALFLNIRRCSLQQTTPRFRRGILKTRLVPAKGRAPENFLGARPGLPLGSFDVWLSVGESREDANSWPFGDTRCVAVRILDPKCNLRDTMCVLGGLECVESASTHSSVSSLQAHTRVLQAHTSGPFSGLRGRGPSQA
jgi:hypothetical protein